jgi:hypothetical protein
MPVERASDGEWGSRECRSPKVPGRNTRTRKKHLFSVPPHGRSSLTGADPTRTAGLNNKGYEHWRDILNI